MGLTFPTAFVKKQTVEFDDPTISWNTGLYWSHDNGQGHVGDTVPFPTKHSDNSIHPYRDGASSYPFEVFIEDSEVPAYDTFGIEEYYTSYGTHTSLYNEGSDAGNSTISPQVYYGWFLTGGYSSAGITSAPHQANPWSVQSEGLELEIAFEADYDTASTSGIDQGDNPVPDIWTSYNAFVQSGSATGSFSLATSKTLRVEVSGLGQDADPTIFGLGGWEPSPFLDYMTLSIYNGSSTSVLCSGLAPQDSRKLIPDVTTLGNFDMQQVKLYSGGSSSIVNYQGKNGGTVDQQKGAVRNSTNTWVDENTRTSYTNINGTGVFGTGLSAGNYQIRIDASTSDGVFNSGAFYGFKFTFS